MAIFYPLCSSSKGNCAYAGSKTDGILIDAGIGIRTFSNLMALAEIPEASVRAIFITHEHSDHISGLRKLTERLGVPVFSTRKILHQLILKNAVAPQTQLFPLEDVTACTDTMLVDFVHTSHDSVDSVSYRIQTQDDKTITICTDLGFVSREISAHLDGSDFVMLESNYDPWMLTAGRYPYYLKRRIAGDRGHLSNEACSAEISRLIAGGTCRFMLAHLSEENNRPEMALAHTVNRLQGEGLLPQRDYTIGVAPKRSVGAVVQI